MTSFTNNRRGFTIVELLVVIAIIAVLAAILFPVFARAKESAKRTSALAQCKQIGTALKMYLDNNDDKYLPSTNYGLPETAPGRMWQIPLEGLVKDKTIFSAPGSDGQFAETWEDRGLMSIGYSSATAIDKSQGCPDNQTDTKGCLSFQSAASFSNGENTAEVGLLAVTPNGPTANNYRGYEFSPYNGPENTEKPKLSPPLASDRDLVKEMSNLPADAIKPVYCRYMSSGNDDGYSPVVFADGHAKDFSAKAITDGSTGIIWRFR
ncbi:MAG: prepilin-type N-terminal cleavage/methylation domain-containing protein [Fimbriimonas sp.]|nr:prepilin-type N-terminal cleavage/methylation domain-containing protein [Fimbriimonas sp.]